MSVEKQQELNEQHVDDTKDIQHIPENQELDEEFAEDLNALLDEIDEILEEDSEEFVENYIQRGGQ